MQKDASLVIVGSGIKCLSHLTHEAKAYITQSTRVLYLLNDPIMKQWIEKNSVSAESLEHLYSKYPLRLHCYRAIRDYILTVLSEPQHVCVVIYGHPTVFAQPALAAAIQAEQLGYQVDILPGISAEDCLFADLRINPGAYGCQSYEATDLLLRQHPINPYAHLLLWQAGVIGALSQTERHNNSVGSRLLQQYLLQYYPAQHIITEYVAAQYPGQNAKVVNFALAELDVFSLNSLATLYLAPLAKQSINTDMLQALKISVSDLA